MWKRSIGLLVLVFLIGLVFYALFGARVQGAGLPVGGIGYHGGYLNVTTAGTITTDSSVDIAGMQGTSFNLQPGEYFVRGGPNTTTLNVTGGTILNTFSDADALAASDTYIANYRKGNVAVSIPGLKPGDIVKVSLKRSEFQRNGGTGLGEISDPTKKSLFLSLFNGDATRGDAFFDHMEAKQGKVDTSGIDGFYKFTQDNNLYSRLHSGFWAYSQPSWMDTYLKNKNVSKINAAVTARLKYMLNGKTWGSFDVYNEPNGDTGKTSYNTVLGQAGIVAMYNQAAALAPNTKMTINNGDLLGIKDTGDGIASYVKYASGLIAAGAKVGELGIEDYNDSPGDDVTPSSFMKNIQSLNVLHVPEMITEFGEFETANTKGREDVVLNQQMRMMFGNPSSIGFTVWEWLQASDNYTPNGLYVKSGKGYKLTPMGVAFMALIKSWDTQTTVTDTVPGQIQFNGYYGDYTLTVNGKAYNLTTQRGIGTYGVGGLVPALAAAAVPEPSTWLLAWLGAACLLVAFMRVSTR